MLAVSEFAIGIMMFLFLIGIILVNGAKIMFGTSGGRQAAGSMLTKWFGS